MRMFLVEKAQFVVLRNTMGKEVHFGSKEYFYRYCPIEEFNINVDDIEYVDYEPDRNLFYVSKNKNMPELIPVPDYEHIIDSVQLIDDRLRNAFWGADEEERRQVIRRARTFELEESDWTQIPDVPFTEEVRQQWKDYRQALRDVPQSGVDVMDYDIFDVFVDEVFPTKPGD